MANNRRLSIIFITLAAFGLAALTLSCTKDETEESVEQAGNDIERVVEDGKNALRSVAEGVNDAVYR